MATNPSALLKGMLSIYSPTGQEEKLAEYILQQMKGPLCYTRVHIDSAGNVIGEVGSGRPIIMLAGHTDTVPGEIPLKESGGRIYARGAADAKGPMAAMMMAASAL